jgi:hypothetical protein
MAIDTIEDLLPAEYNPRRDMTDAERDGLQASLKRFGDVGGITFNRRSGRLVCGHQRVARLRELGATMVDGALQLPTGERWPVRVVDWDDSEERAANVTANNRHIASDWDDSADGLLTGIRESIGEEDFAGLGLDALLTSGDIQLQSGAEGDDERYTQKIGSPVYETTGEQPSLSDLYDTTKADELQKAISEASVPDDVRRFLEMAALRHTVFNYQAIAEYYAHAPADVQSLMEDSALVIIDFNRAIELGFVKMSERIADAADEETET